MRVRLDVRLGVAEVLELAAAREDLNRVDLLGGIADLLPADEVSDLVRLELGHPGSGFTFGIRAFAIRVPAGVRSAVLAVVGRAFTDRAGAASTPFAGGRGSTKLGGVGCMARAYRGIPWASRLVLECQGADEPDLPLQPSARRCNST